jgi:outer membrane autotransporter protein
MDVALIGGWNRVKASRNIQFSIFDRTARHDQDNIVGQANLELGARYSVGKVQFRPFGSADYIYIQEEKFKERSALAFDLKVKEKNTQLLRTELGLNLTVCIPASKFNWVPEGKCSWVRETRLSGKNITAQFLAAGPEFTVKGDYPTRDLLAAGAGLSFLPLHNNSSSLSFYYDTQMGTRYFEQAFSLQFSYRF